MAPITASSVATQLSPSADQETNLFIIAGMAVAILILWNVPYLKLVLYPFKIVTVGLHEFGHASAGLCTGAKIDGIELDPDEGGVTHLRGGNPYITLPAGYIGSSVWGALLVFAGFDTLASQIASIVLGVIMLLVLYWAKNWLTRGICFLFMGLIVGLWFVDGGKGLRYFVLFMGTMSVLYSLFDIVEDLISRRVNESDASKFSKICCGGCLPPQVWGCLWLLVSLIFLSGAIVGALAYFKNN
ncbi:hypothetical protein SmJEL517_g01622 [Synchytrium microbalum]|uniref:Peptidase M50B-like-domain-containing protein n=1 Tax=Synchytrium microbalum TaxID=1806994 RepID=A0A507CFL5_9FUNG|nr:uncharacterized protein SmJEL517_g01622 [Synchytrium microbalum]TPX36303.1 hypothetical protein SmJEL517_g01622 [Synchytrium microbalum]